MAGDEKKAAGPEQRENQSNKQNSNRWPRRSQQQKGVKQGETFKGNNEDLEGFVYTYDGHAKASQFQKTTEKIGEWAKRNCPCFPLDVWKGIETLEEPDFNEWRPDAPENMEDVVEAAIFKEEVQEYGKRKRAYRDNSTKVYTIVIGQCSEATKAKLEAIDDWDDINGEHNLVQLLKAVKSLMHNQIQGGRHAGLTAYESLRALLSIRQQRHEETAHYRKRFTAARDVLEHVGMAFGGMFQGIADSILVSDYNTTREDATDAQALAAEADAGENVLAIMFLRQACTARYGEITRELQNDFLKDKDNYPSNVTAAYNMLANWNRGSSTGDSAPPLDGLAYTMASEHDEDVEIALAQGEARKGKDYSKIVCNHCKKKGHMWRRCPKLQELYSRERGETTGSTSMMVDNSGPSSREGGPQWGSTFGDDGLYNDGAVLCQGSEEEEDSLAQDDPESKFVTTSYDQGTQKVLPAGSIGLDSLSTVDLFCDPRMLTNIRKVAQGMRIQCNAGFKTVSHMGSLAGYGDVWFDPTAVANILSLGRVAKRYKVTFDSEGEEGFILHLPDGRTRNFKETARGLYATQFLKTRGTGESHDVALTIATVEGNKTQFTKREVKQAELARRLQTTLLFPSDRHLIKITEVLQDCPVSAQDVANANAIFGPSVGALKGKTTSSRSIPVTVVPVQIPRTISARLKNLHLHADVCFVNGTGFVVSITDKIKFCTAEAVGSRTNDVLVATLNKIQSIYRQGGYRVHVVSLDGEFTSARERIRDEAQMDMNPVAAGEHAPVVERHIRHLKEGVRGMYQMLPFDKKRKLPQRMIIELVYAKTFFKNAVPALDGVSNVLAPREIVTQQRINYKRHCVLMFGQYVQTHEEHDNSMQSRTIGAIAMRPTGARQGGYVFFSLQTGRLITRNHWTECVMPRDVIERVHSLARRNDMVGVEFRDRAGDLLEDDDLLDDDEASFEDNQSDANSDAGAFSGEESDEDDDTHTAGVGGLPEKDPWNNSEGDDAPIAEVGGPGNEIETHETDDGSEESSAEMTEEQDLEERYGPRTTAYNLRPRKPPRYDVEALLAMGDVKGAGKATIESFKLSEDIVSPKCDTAALADESTVMNNDLFEVMMTQYGLKKGLKIFGDKGTKAVHKEMKQIHDREVLIPVDASKMSRGDKAEALRYLMFLKEKSDGTIKGRGCADGRKQRRFIGKDSASSPTISTEALFLIATIAAKEGRKVVTVDVPGAYLQTELKDEKVVVKFEGKMAELLEMIDPKLYRKHLVVEKGVKVLYAELAKVLYGILRGALLFWEKVSAQLVEWGFVINPYDWCVANKYVEYGIPESNGKAQPKVESAQMTLGWHVDDFIITHKCQKVIDDFVQKMDDLYGGDMAPLTVNRGYVHAYLGMELDFKKPGKVMVKMLEYVRDLLLEAPGDFSGEAATPAAAHLFEVDLEATKLCPEKATTFHHLVAKALFLCKRARPDTQMTVGFLCSRVKEPDVDDWKKLKRFFQYLRGTKDLSLTLEAEEAMVAKWWIDASYAVHPDCRSHSGATFSLGKGTLYSGSHRQKLNSKSSTEAEVIAVDDFIGQVLWTQYFLQAQGYAVKKSVVYQDNQSAILLEKNGRKSGSKRTRHINVRYYFITDRINKGEVQVGYCPTGDMVADFFTKPLQGSAFRKFRDAILNIQHGD